MEIGNGVSLNRPWHMVGLVVVIYCLLNLALPKLPVSPLIQTYLLQPLPWLFLAAAVWKWFPPYRPAGKLQIKSSVIQLAVMIGVLQVVFCVIGGLFSGFGKSPYPFTLEGITGNLVLMVSTLVGTELSRAWLINRLGKKHTFLALAFVVVLYTILSVSLSQITEFKLEMESIKLVNSTWLPLLAENILASLLAFLAGPWASIGYRGVVDIFWWFSPILPDLPWAFKGIIGTVVPIMGVITVNSYYRVRSNRASSRQQRKRADFPAGWIVTAVVSVLVVWFSIGLFPFQPAVVGSGSMSPVMETGDIVIVTKANSNIVDTGDIIQFRKENITIMHRVIEIRGEEEAKLFRTKGDANNSPDPDLVAPDSLIGKIIIVVPKVGWVSIFVKNFFSG